MIAIIGRGNVASHLFTAIKEKTEVVMVNPHTLEDLPEKAEIILLCVSDKAISEVFNKLSVSGSIIAHTSGSMPMDILKGNSPNFGVIYPLQTFTKGLKMTYDNIPVFIEGSNPDTVEKLKHVASLISEDIREADSNERKKLHLASVFACNFTNALAGISEEILKDSGIDFSAILPLMDQTVKKLKTLSPKEAQTGPARRGDKDVMKVHLKMLEQNPDIQKIYSLLSAQISKS